MTFCQETKDFIFQNERMIGDLKKNPSWLDRRHPCVEVEEDAKAEAGTGGWESRTFGALLVWSKMVTVRCWKMQGGVSSGFQDQNTFGIALWFRCCRFFAVHTTNFTTMIRMLPGDAAAQCFRSKNFQLFLLLSSHVEIGEATSLAFSGFFLSFSAKYIWEE